MRRRTRVAEMGDEAGSVLPTDHARPDTEGRAPSRRGSGPLVIVGQARSGTSLMTRVLADARRFALINDAYLLQYLDGFGASDALDLQQRRRLADFVLNEIRSRLVSDSEREMFRSIYLTPAQLEDLERRADRFISQSETGWDLIEALLNATAVLSGCEVWGWKCPPDYMHVDRILAHFPNARFIFVIRDPFKTMRSYKNWPWKHGRARYHPLIQAIVWRSVVEKYREASARHPGRMLLVRFEDLVNQTGRQKTELAAFLGDFPWPRTTEEVTPNTSISGASKELTWLEWKICQMVTGPYLRRFDYGGAGQMRTGIGIVDFVSASLKCGGYYASLACHSRDMRNRLKLYVATLLRGRERSAIPPPLRTDRCGPVESAEGTDAAGVGE
jgi:Sulfotransferase family